MRVLVTGASGFLGQYVAEQLAARGDTVRVLVRRDVPELAKLGIEIARGDVRDPEAVRQAAQGVEVVFHVAGVAGIWGPWQHYYATNTLGTENVIAACRREGVGRLVYTSSPSVTFDGTPQCGVDESGPYSERWLCHYPHSKALAEQAVLAANGPELATCALRPHLIWGPRDHHLVPRLLARARAGRLRRVGDGTNRIDMVYVENAAAAHLLAAEALAAGRAGGKAYYISQGEPVNCWQWIDELLALAGLQPVKRSISFGSAWRVGAACEAIYTLLGIKSEPPMTRFLASQLAESHYFNLDAARRDLGYVPAVSTAEGMLRLAESWKGATVNEP
ncbi:MAG TPA: NAD-dependent epimerase/dehydratase family protein [Pirellulales bacterium]|nr:NAD-dependent epimerase/dehydratase family protein [Pirellulales bacterium]